MGCFCSRCSLFFCHHTRMRVLSLKSTLTQHAHRRCRLCEDTHTRMKAPTCRGEAPIQGSRSRLEDQRSEKHKSNAHRTSTVFTVERNDQAMQSHQSTLLLSATKQTMWWEFPVNKGLQPCRALAGADMVDAALISALYYKRRQALPQTPPCWHSQSFSTRVFPALPHTHTVRKCWLRKRENFKANPTVDAFFSSEEWCFMFDQSTVCSVYKTKRFIPIAQLINERF